jgi:hypothetical protein
LSVYFSILRIRRLSEAPASLTCEAASLTLAPKWESLCESVLIKADEPNITPKGPGSKSLGPYKVPWLSHYSLL